MALLDSQGRLFGKVSILDIGAALVILMVLVGIFFFPGTSSVAQLGAATKPVEVDVIARGLSTSTNARELIVVGKKANFIIRNQPSGQVEVKAVTLLPRSVPVPQPDGSVKALPDPRPELQYTADVLMTLEGNATITSDGPVLSRSKVKVGNLVQIEGPTYDIQGSIVGVRVLK